MKYYLLILAMITCYTTTAQQQWKLTKEEDGIKIFIADDESSKFKSVRVQCVLEGTISKLITILKDVKAYDGWIYKTKQAYMLKQPNPAEFIYYLETNMPWPVKNRDGIYHLKINYDTANRKMVINGISEPTLIPTKENIVRISSIKTSWHVTESDKQIAIEYFFQVDPAGSLPAWIANAFADKGPFESFKQLAVLLKK